MSGGIADDLLEQFSSFVAANMGLLFTKKQWTTLQRGICSAAGEFGFRDAEACVRWLMSSSLTREQVEILASSLTVGETYFWREEKSLDALREEVLPALIRARRGGERRLRIWSAGCSTGEEPYSLAILLDRMEEAFRNWKIVICATDINPRALERAGAGVYSEWSFRGTPPWVRSGYFRRREDGRFEILPRIRRMVEFSYLNLVEDVYPSLLNNTNAMDLIFCRNVLMYFEPELARQVVHRFRLCLVENGWLVVSPCEISSALFPGFAARNFRDAVLYQKRGIGEAGKRGSGEPFPPFPTFPPSPVREMPPPVPEVLYFGNREAEKQGSGEAVSPLPEIDVSPVQEGASYEKALLFYEQGLYGEAAETLTTLLAEGGNDARAAALLCRINANQGKLAEALQLSERALAADKLDAGLHCLHAAILQEQGALEGAVASLKRALYLDPNLVIAHFALGNLSLRQGKGKESRRHFNNALAILGRYGQDEILPESEGIPAGRLTEIIKTIAVGM